MSEYNFIFDVIGTTNLVVGKHVFNAE